jgi:hypothetical protein
MTPKEDKAAEKLAYRFIKPSRKGYIERHLSPIQYRLFIE